MYANKYVWTFISLYSLIGWYSVQFNLIFIGVLQEESKYFYFFGKQKYINMPRSEVHFVLGQALVSLI